jgi:carboxypeptidase C (cathepsin A)
MIFSTALLLALMLQPQAPPAAPQPKPDAAKPETPPAVKEETAVTRHSLRIGGQTIDYTATAGTIVLKKEDGTPRASLFYIAYTKNDPGDLSKRPLTFAFNGGPGSSSVWLHMGALGPKRVLMDELGNPPPPPYQLVDNEYSILDLTDLVFIDPVSTGFSRAAQEKEAAQFHGFREDLNSVGEFIRMYTTRSHRWVSPKYLAGESYGTTRAAGLSGHLQDSLGMNLNGIVLISAVLNFQTVAFDPGNDLPYALFLPTYTATAWYHKKLGKDLQGDLREALRESERFASGEYTLALMKGGRLGKEERAEIVKKLARYTGLTPRYIEQANLRVRIHRFVKELLRDERRTVGRFDSRYKGMDHDAAGEGFEYDPSYAVVQGPYTGAFNQYVRETLKFSSDLPYEILTGRVRPWSWAPYENRFVNVADTLRSAMTKNPNLRLFVGKGYYDLATPYFAADYTLDHLALEPELRKNISGSYYEAGHMYYLHKPSLEKMKRDLAAFIR